MNVEERPADGGDIAHDATWASPGPAELAPDELAPGMRVGRYELGERLGAGAMGVVYRAHDPELDRSIALKVLRRGPEAPEERQLRMRREAQAMARLSHPNVIAIHDVGTAGGQVFVAMELVVGETLRAWLGPGRPWREIVEVFVAAGRGLAAAHAAGLCHRDFKPDNVLLGGDRRARVTDFGIARPLGASEGDGDGGGRARRPSDLDLELTQTGSLVGTPAYMAPEQLRGERADAAADQYSFCVALFEALAGVPPFAGDDLPALLAAREAERLSPVAAAAEVPRRIREVLVRGLRADPAARFPSMATLLAGLEAGLRRRRGWAWLAGAAGVGLVGLGAWFVWPAPAPGSATCGAVASLEAIWGPEQAGAVAGEFGRVRPAIGEDTAGRVGRLLDGYARDWVTLRGEVCRTRASRSDRLFDKQMACLDERRDRLSALVDGLVVATGATVDGAVRAARDLPPIADCGDEVALGDEVPLPSDRAALARIGSARQALDRVRAARAAGQGDRGLAAAEAVLGEARSLAYPPLIAAVLLELGRIQSDGGDWQLARATLEEAARVAADGRDDVLAADAWLALVDTVGLDGARVKEAAAIVPAAEAAVRRAGNRPNQREHFLMARGALEQDSGDPRAGLASLEEALAVGRTLYGADDSRLADIHLNLGSVHRALADYPAAITEYRQARAIYQAGLGDQHVSVGQTLHYEGMVLAATGDRDGARRLYDQARALYEQNLGPRSALVSDVLQSLGNLAFAEGDRAKAIELLEQALAIRRELHDLDHPSVASAMIALANVYDEDGRGAEARKLYEEALPIDERVLGPDSTDLAMALYNFADLLAGEQFYEQATSYYQRALTGAEHGLGSDSGFLAYPLRGLGQVLLFQHRDREAIEPLERARGLCQRQPCDPLMAAAIDFTLGEALWSSGKDRPGGLALARQGRDELRKLGPGARGQLAAAEAWLAK